MPDNRPQDWYAPARNLTPEWTAERAFSVKSAVVARYRRRIRNRKIFIAALLIAPAAAVLVWTAHARWTSPVSVASSQLLRIQQDDVYTEKTPTSSPVDPGEFEPRATPMTPGTKYSLVQGTTSGTYRIQEGSVRFETFAPSDQQLIVQVGDVVIEDIGTIFVVEAVETDRARVTVEEGIVVVRWPGGTQHITAPNEGVFPPLLNSTTGKNARRDLRIAAERARKSTWRTHARAGRYAAALQLIDEDESRVRAKVDDWLLAADVMRRTAQPARAVRYLEQIVEHHPGDDRVSLAAFTMGRVFLDELGRPRQAARAFAAAGARSGPLAEEACVREVEAWHKAGEPEAARQAALLYLERFPKGPSARRVQVLGGIDPTP